VRAVNRRHANARPGLHRTGSYLAGAVGVVLFLACVGAAADSPGRTLNGFVLEPANIPTDEILRGGPPRDAIPALDHPETQGAEYRWDDSEMVVGVERNQEARAYPLSILVWHELVNDTVGGLAILVSYCPLCGTAIVFDRRLPEEGARRFGVSGLLYQSDLLMYDHETESLWSQISAHAVTGALRGTRLPITPSRIVTWKQWRTKHPHTTVLTRNTGHRRNYAAHPYTGYATSRKLMFPVSSLDRRYPPKMRTVGLRLADGTARAYPLREIVAAGGTITERFGGGEVRVAWETETETFEVEAPAGVEVIEGYWFAWAAFHRETTVALGLQRGSKGKR
jgi:hypothetical protein